MNFMPLAWLPKIARKAQERWNAEHPERLVPWEWLEQCLIHWRAWKEQVSYAPEEVEVSRERYEEFARKLPPALLEEIFPKARDVS